MNDQIQTTLKEIKELDDKRNAILSDFNSLGKVTGIHNRDNYAERVEAAKKEWENYQSNFLASLHYLTDINGEGEKLKLAYLNFKEKENKLGEYDKQKLSYETQLSDLNIKRIVLGNKLVSAIIGKE